MTYAWLHETPLDVLRQAVKATWPDMARWNRADILEFVRVERYVRAVCLAVERVEGQGE